MYIHIPRRYFLDTIPTWLMDTWWLKDIKATHISQDSLPVMRNVAQSEYYTFGDRKLRETVQALQPFRLVPNQEIKHILYVHGGGFIAANAKLLMPSITPVVREGYTIWCTNYPLSPWNKFPTAVTSVLACLQWLKREHGIEQVALIGDSAGGALATSAAAFATNPHLFKELWGTPGVSKALRQKDTFPEISGVVSLYGVLDKESWKSVNKPSAAVLSALENELSSFGLDFCVWAYRNKSHPLDKNTFVCEMVPRLKTYPKTLLICGDQDVLVHSSRACEKALRKHGFQCHLSVYKARHAFVGLPPALNLGDEWKRHSLPATNEMKLFLRGLNLNSKKKKKKPVADDDVSIASNNVLDSKEDVVVLTKKKKKKEENKVEKHAVKKTPHDIVKENKEDTSKKKKKKKKRSKKRV